MATRGSGPAGARSRIFALPSPGKRPGPGAWRGQRLAEPWLAPSTKRASEPVCLRLERVLAFFFRCLRKNSLRRDLYHRENTPKNRNYRSEPPPRGTTCSGDTHQHWSLLKAPQKPKSCSKRNLCALLSKLFHVLFFSPAADPAIARALAPFRYDT